jgi:hypothetical protein
LKKHSRINLLNQAALRFSRNFFSPCHDIIGAFPGRVGGQKRLLFLRYRTEDEGALHTPGTEHMNNIRTWKNMLIEPGCFVQRSKVTFLAFQYFAHPAESKTTTTFIGRSTSPS